VGASIGVPTEQETDREDCALLHTLCRIPTASLLLRATSPSTGLLLLGSLTSVTSFCSPTQAQSVAAGLAGSTAQLATYSPGAGSTRRLSGAGPIPVVLEPHGHLALRVMRQCDADAEWKEGM
jgi:hypothetical protein